MTKKSAGKANLGKRKVAESTKVEGKKETTSEQTVLPKEEVKKETTSEQPKDKIIPTQQPPLPEIIVSQVVSILYVFSNGGRGMNARVCLSTGGEVFLRDLVSVTIGQTVEVPRSMIRR